MNDFVAQLDYTTKSLPIKHIDVMALTRTARQMVESAKNIIVDSPAMYDEARAELTMLKAQRTAIEDGRLERTRPLDEKKKELMDEVREPLELYDQAIGAVSGAATAYARKVENDRRETERLQREAEQRERNEREAKAREADELAQKERERQADLVREAEQKAEDARIARIEAVRAAEAGDAAVAAQRMAESVVASEEAQKLEQASGEAAKQAHQASTIAQETRFAPPTVHTAPVAPAKGTRRSWKAECTDKAALLAYVAGNPAFLNLFDINQSALTALAKAQGEHLNIPGVRAYEDLGVVAKRR